MRRGCSPPPLSLPSPVSPSFNWWMRNSNHFLCPKRRSEEEGKGGRVTPIRGERIDGGEEMDGLFREDTINGRRRGMEEW